MPLFTAKMESNLRLHLRANFYPPHPASAIESMVKGIREYWEGNIGVEKLTKACCLRNQSGLFKYFGDFLPTDDNDDIVIRHDDNLERQEWTMGTIRVIKHTGEEINQDKLSDLLERLEAIDANTIESHARQAIVDALEELEIDSNAISVLFDGNSVYRPNEILAEIDKIEKQGMIAMSDKLYKFVINACGSIAHYDRGGWVQEYPTFEAFKGFCRQNEYGQDIKSYQPGWAWDRIKIAERIFERYMS